MNREEMTLAANLRNVFFLSQQKNCPDEERRNLRDSKESTTTDDYEREKKG